MPVEIPLTRGYVALVDREDAEHMLAHAWRADVHKNGKVYAITSPNRKITIFMHRLVLGLPRGDPRRVDHRDHDGLNNQRHNLRPCNQSQNIQSQRINIRKNRNQNGYHGVVTSRDDYRGRITIGGHQIYTGAFDTPFEAAVARDRLAIKHYGEFASLNFPHIRLAA